VAADVLAMALAAWATPLVVAASPQAAGLPLPEPSVRAHIRRLAAAPHRRRGRRGVDRRPARLGGGPGRRPPPRVGSAAGHSYRAVVAAGRYAGLVHAGSIMMPARNAPAAGAVVWATACLRAREGLDWRAEPPCAASAAEGSQSARTRIRSILWSSARPRRARLQRACVLDWLPRRRGEERLEPPRDRLTPRRSRVAASASAGIHRPSTPSRACRAGPTPAPCTSRK
jgi:hypothetical protein